MKNLSVFSLKLFFFFDTLLKEARESICSSVGLVLSIINTKIILEKLFGSPDLSRAQTLYIHKMTKVIIIGE